MTGSTVGLRGGVEIALAGAVVPLRAVDTAAVAIDPAAVVDLPGPVRALVAFALVLLVGGGLLWRFEAFVDRSIDATMARPLWAVGYGVAAHATIGFAGLYLTTRFAQVDVSGWNAGGIGVLIGALLALLAGALGFSVVGTTLVGLLDDGGPWSGLIVGALVAGAVAVLDPLFGGVAWVAIASLGIGGAVRRWVHASAGPDA